MLHSILLLSAIFLRIVTCENTSEPHKILHQTLPPAFCYNILENRNMLLSFPDNIRNEGTLTWWNLGAEHLHGNNVHHQHLWNVVRFVGKQQTSLCELICSPKWDNQGCPNCWCQRRRGLCTDSPTSFCPGTASSAPCSRSAGTSSCRTT